MDFIPAAMPGFDASKITHPNPYIIERSPEKFAQFIQGSLTLLGEHRLLLVTSFNEWHEGTQIEPSEEFGYSMLQALAEVINAPEPASIPTPTPTPTKTAAPETFFTQGGVEYLSGIDGDFQYLESVDGSVRVEGPDHIADEDLQRYLDRTYEANSFVANFFDFVPPVGIRSTISPNGTHYIMGNLSGARSDFYPFDLDSHLLYNDHDSIVHEFAHVWNHKYLPSGQNTGEFWAQYLGNASTFVRNDEDIEKFSLENCNIKCQGGFYDSEGNLLYNLHIYLENQESLSPVGWGNTRHVTLEEDGFDFMNFKTLAKQLTKKYDMTRERISIDDYEEAIKSIKSSEL